MKLNENETGDFFEIAPSNEPKLIAATYRSQINVQVIERIIVKKSLQKKKDTNLYRSRIVFLTQFWMP